MFRMFWVGIFVFAMMFSPVPVSRAAESLKIGYVDAVKVLDNTSAGKRAKETLEEFLQSRQKIIDLDEAELNQLQEDLARQAAVLNPEALREKEASLQKKIVGYQQRVGQFKSEVESKRKEVLERFNKDLEGVVRVIAKKEGYDLVMDNNHELGFILYGSESLDLTDKVVGAFEKTHP